MDPPQLKQDRTLPVKIILSFGIRFKKFPSPLLAIGRFVEFSNFQILIIFFTFVERCSLDENQP